MQNPQRAEQAVALAERVVPAYLSRAAQPATSARCRRLWVMKAQTMFDDQHPQNDLDRSGRSAVKLRAREAVTEIGSDQLEEAVGVEHFIELGQYRVGRQAESGGELQEIQRVIAVTQHAGSPDVAEGRTHGSPTTDQFRTGK